MSHSKLENNKLNCASESILLYLKYDLTDIERKNVLENLLQSSKKLTLLDCAIAKWKVDLVEQKINISVFEERIRLTTMYSKHGFFDKSAQTVMFEKKTNKYNELLVSMKSDFMKSATKASQSLKILEELLVNEEEEVCLNNSTF